MPWSSQSGKHCSSSAAMRPVPVAKSSARVGASLVKIFFISACSSSHIAARPGLSRKRAEYASPACKWLVE